MPTTQQKCKAIRNRLYPESEWPGVRHRQNILAHAAPDRVYLEIGAGRMGKLLQAIAPSYRFSYGMDLEVAVEGNDDARWKLIQGDAHELPFEDNHIDVIAMQDVVEHLADPHRVFRECARVLKPGGHLLVATVNQWFPPIVAARMMPHWLRQKVNRIATGTVEEDTFPAFYRANSAKSLVSAANQAGFETTRFEYVSSHPQYLMFSVPAYRVGIMFERMVRRNEWLRNLRHFLHCEFTLPKVPSNGRPVGDRA
jgi:ubiquinone/menaquinone biosynthesis C-methylase UbiE